MTVIKIGLTMTTMVTRTVIVTTMMIRKILLRVMYGFGRPLRRGTCSTLTQCGGGGGGRRFACLSAPGSSHVLLKGSEVNGKKPGPSSHPV